MLTRGARARRAVRAQRQAKLQAALEELMTLVLRTVNDKKDHIPPVVSSAVLTFSFEISVAGYVAAHALLACARFDMSVAGCVGARATACSACLCELCHERRRFRRGALDSDSVHRLLVRAVSAAGRQRDGLRYKRGANVCCVRLGPGGPTAGTAWRT